MGDCGSGQILFRGHAVVDASVMLEPASSPAKKKSTIEIANEFHAWLEKVELTDGELTPELMQEFEAIEMDRLAKLGGIASVHRRAKLAEDSAKAELDRIAKIHRREQSVQNFMKGRARVLLEQIEGKKAKVGTHSLWIQPNGASSIDVEDLERVPAGWKTFEIKASLNREMILTEHAAGNPLPPGITITRGDHVRIS